MDPALVEPVRELPESLGRAWMKSSPSLRERQMCFRGELDAGDGDGCQAQKTIGAEEKQRD